MERFSSMLAPLRSDEAFPRPSCVTLFAASVPLLLVLGALYSISTAASALETDGGVSVAREVREGHVAAPALLSLAVDQEGWARMDWEVSEQPWHLVKY